MSNGKLVKAAVVALSCTFGLVGCGTYNYTGGFQRQAKSSVEPTQQVAAQEQEVVKQLVSSTYNFKFDNAALNEDAKSELNQFAQYLAKNGEAKVHVEGYADARGKPEYNVALGMRRAESVAKFLKENGVQESQIETRSFGSERLADMSDSAEANAANRRAVVYFEVESEIV
tara:strand:- start:76849 stop:77364 length:516 start_codon:yes stop_codon:yes gene_type:complete